MVISITEEVRVVITVLYHTVVDGRPRPGPCVIDVIGIIVLVDYRLANGKFSSAGSHWSRAPVNRPLQRSKLVIMRYRGTLTKLSGHPCVHISYLSRFFKSLCQKYFHYPPPLEFALVSYSVGY